MSGRWRNLVVVGVALSPEYVYTIGPGALMPDDLRYGVLWMGRETLQAAYDLEGAFNEVSASLLRGANPERVVDEMDRLLDRYGSHGAYVRADQASNWFLTNEIDQLETMARFLPTVFLAVAAFLTNMVRRPAGGGRTTGNRVAEGVRLRQYRNRMALREARARDRRGGDAARLVLRLLARPLQHHHVRRFLSVPIPAVPAERRPVPARSRCQCRRRAAGCDRCRASSRGTVACCRDAAARPAPVPAQPAVPVAVLRAARPAHADRAAPDLPLAPALRWSPAWGSRCRSPC